MILLLAYSILLATRTAVADVPARLRDLAAHLSGGAPRGRRRGQPDQAGLGVALGALTAEVGGEVAQARGNVGDGRARGEQDRVGQEQDR